MSGYDVTALLPRLAALRAEEERLAAERAGHESAWQQRRLALAEGGELAPNMGIVESRRAGTRTA